MKHPAEIAAAATLDVEFAFHQHGRRFYRVRKGGREIFLGLRGECERYARIHVDKVLREILRVAPPRDRRFRVRSFRVLRRRAMSA
jgi:hypothetical protein